MVAAGASRRGRDARTNQRAAGGNPPAKKKGCVFLREGTRPSPPRMGAFIDQMKLVVRHDQTKGTIPESYVSRIAISGAVLVSRVAWLRARAPPTIVLGILSKT